MPSTFYSTLALAAMCCTTAFAQSDNTTAFPEEGKTYLIHRYANENSYVHDNAGMLSASPKSNQQKQYWRFISTGEPSRFYIQNVTSERYMQSTKLDVAGEAGTQVATGDEPVEFEVEKNTSSTAANGFYYLCSTDQDIDTSTDGTLGLNYQESSGKVVAFHIRYNRGNSYWDIVESDYDYDVPERPEPTALAKRLGLYYLPCGARSTAYLSRLNIKNEAWGSAMNFRPTTPPTDYFIMHRTDSVAAAPGAELNVDYTARGLKDEHNVTFYTDWDGDGVFETAKALGTEDKGTFTLTVPKDAKKGRVRLRVRLNDNGLEEADDEVHGMVYDFFVFVMDSAPATGITPPVTTVTDGDKNGAAYALDGRRVRLDSYKGVYVQNGRKRIK